ncbi:MAG: hypothetical protein Q9170_003067 [Blastenia crenularia]
MHLQPVLLTTLLISGQRTSGAPVSDHSPTVRAVKASEALIQRSPNVQSPHVLTLNRKPSVDLHPPRYGKSLQIAREGNDTVGIAALEAFRDIVYFTDITFGTETFKAVVDTGSADTWLVQSGFQCLSIGRQPITLPEESCDFGPSYIVTSTFKQIEGENFNVTYADGEVLTGIVGTEDVTLAGITVKGQEVGLINRAAWNGDNSSSGLIGLAFPNLTSVFSGSDPALDDHSKSVASSPLFTTMYNQGLVAPLFSLAIERGAPLGGLLALGGLPPVQHSPYFACTPFRKTVLRYNTDPEYEYYTITLDGFSYGNQTEVSMSTEAIVDSGTSLTFLPRDIAIAINKLFVPRPYLSDLASNQWTVDCAAKAPKVGISIANHTFFINPTDLIIKHTDGSCITGIVWSGANRPAILGDVFLKNVLAVFDVGASEIRFASREYY